MRNSFHIRRTAIDGIEAVTADSSRSFARHTHDTYGIGVILSGAQKSASGRGPVEAGPGQTITVNPGEVHDGVPLDGGARVWRMLYMNPILVAEAAGDIFAGRPREEFHAPVFDDARIAARFHALFRSLTCAEGGTGTPIREERLLMLLAAIMRERPHEPHLPAVDVAPARARLDDDPAGAVTLADLARECGTDRFRLLRDFSRATGLTPHAYLVQRRLDLARRLIARGMPLAEAAASAGFADQSHMTRHFVRRHGYTPGRYAAAFA